MDWIEESLAELLDSSMKRSLRLAEARAGSTIIVNGKPYIDFSSNDYLGLSRHMEVLNGVRQILDHWGAGAESSRLLGGTSINHQNLEESLAAFFKKEAGLLFPSGYMANMGVITSLVGAEDVVILDRLCHASLVDAARLSGAKLLVYKHGDVEDAEHVLKRASSFRRRLLVTESVFSMDGDVAPVKALGALCKQYDTMGLLDEAHAVGVWGPHGSGIAARDEATDSWDVIVGTLSKSLGSQGGFCVSSNTVREWLINKARAFIFTTGLSPLCVSAAQSAMSLLQEADGARKDIALLSNQLRVALRERGFDTMRSVTQIIPILVGEADKTMELAKRLDEAGIFAPAIRPPTVSNGECRLRFSITAEHKTTDLDKVIAALTF